MNKFKLLILFVLILHSSFYSQQYYYADGKKIELSKRKDQLSIIINQTALNQSVIYDELKVYVNPGETLEYLRKDLWLIKFNQELNESSILNRIAQINSLTGIVKFAGEVFYGESKKVTQIVTDELIVKLKDLRDFQNFADLNTSYNIEIVENINDENTFVLKSLNDVKQNALSLSEIYLNTGIFEYCEPNFTYPDGCLFNYDPNDTYYTSQWTLKNTGQSVPTGGDATGGDLTTSAGISDADMDVDLAWNYTKGNINVIVGVFDTGVDSAHADLYQNLITGYDATTGVSSVKTDPLGHGTCTAGIIGARTNNGIGVSGIVGGDNTPNSNCKIRMFKLVNSSGTFTTNTNIANAFNLARTSGVHVSSNSWGGGTPSTTLTDAINNLSNNGRSGLGCVVLFSSGNDGRNPPSYPSYLSSVVCVGASTRHDQKKDPGTGNQWWWGGNYGSDANGDLDIVAPTICYTTDITGSGGYAAGDYDDSFNGTSAACPNAAGVAALIFSINPNFTRDQVLNYLYRGCEKIDNANYSTLKTYGYWNDYFGYGRVNAYNSVRLAMGVDVTPPTIIHKNISSHSSTYPTLLTATIVDQDGASVPVSGTHRPRIYYRFNKNATGWTSFVQAYSVSNAGNQFTFQIPCVGRQTEVQYYIEAEDVTGNVTTFPLHASATYPYTLCYFAVGNITYETHGLTSSWSPPNSAAQISSSINFPNSFPILEAKVKINLSITLVSQIMLMLWSPGTDANQNRVGLFSYNGNLGNNISNATVTDSATQFWNQGTPPYTNGYFKPEYMLNSLKGANALGNWRFINIDNNTLYRGTYNTLDITLKRMNGITSSAARLNSPVDSVLYFGNPSSPTIVERDFYLKNVGNSNLTVSGVSFSGTYASMFSLISALPGAITLNDSALFRVRLTYNSLPKLNKILAPDAFENAVMSIANNDPSKPVFKVSLQTDSPLPVELSAFYASVINKKVNLKWRTDTEVNNYGFDIERKPYTSDIPGVIKWNKIGFVPGSGNSNSPKDYSFEDAGLTSGKYSYRLKQIDNDGQSAYSNVVDIDLGVPVKFALVQNYPNPFNSSTLIKYQLPLNGNVSLKVYDILGNEAAVLFEGYRAAGEYNAEFDASALSSGIYFYRLTAGDNVSTKKMILLK